MATKVTSAGATLQVWWSWVPFEAFGGCQKSLRHHFPSNVPLIWLLKLYLGGRFGLSRAKDTSQTKSKGIFEIGA